MTFTEWINTQEDICSKLREQDTKKRMTFVNFLMIELDVF
jgi:hypothetical protein